MTWKLARRNLLSSKLRLFLTSIAIVLGVGFVVAAFVLGDTITKTFDDVFSNANQGVAVSVRGKAVVSDLDRKPVPASLLPKVQAVDGVAQADGTVAGSAVILKSNGDPAGLDGPPSLGFSWPQATDLNPFRVLEGRAPVAADDVVVDKTTADRAKFAVGDMITVVTAVGPAKYRLVGIVGFGDTNNLAGATIASFTPQTAGRVFESQGRFVTIDVSSQPGVTQEELARRVQAVLPSGYEAVTGQQSAEETSRQFTQFVDIFRNFLLGFAFIALFVGSFIIYNAFKITVAQRNRQVGLLRAVGASGGQIVRSVLIEAFVIGAVASVIGVLFGIVMAAGLRALFNAVGASLPSTTLQVLPRSVIFGLAVGVLVTLFSAFGPAWRSSRVPPIAALRDIEVHGSRTVRLILASVLTLGGIALVLTGNYASISGLAQRFALIGVGAMLLFIGAAMLTQYVVRPLATVLGAPMARLGLAGRLGRENAMRNPSRTAQTAAALTIGVALVTGVAVFASSLEETFVGTLDKRVRADLIVFSPNGEPFSPVAGRDLASLPEVASSTAWRDGQFKDDNGDVQNVSGVDPAVINDMYDADPVDGDLSDLSTPDTIAISESYAKDNSLVVGSTLPALFAESGQQRFTVASVFKDTSFGDFFVSLKTLEPNTTSTQDGTLLARAAPGVTPDELKVAADASLGKFGNLEVYTKQGYRNFVGDQINGLLNLFYILLGLALLIAVFGIVLTLALSVFERTREIGLLRAVGLARRSVRAMIRWEAILVCLVGAVVGIVIGLFLGVVSVNAIPDFTATAIPWGSLVSFLVVAVIFGIIAAMLPARRAARLTILEAIANE
ncbi:MAG: FtsX-like permease family protein [Thermoleophilia bacterium]